MKYLDSRSVLDHYDRDEELYVLPEEFTLVHALFAPARRSVINRDRLYEHSGSKPKFLDHWFYEVAACRKRIKVVLPVPFDDADPDACPRCATEAARRSEVGPAMWEADQRKRQADRAQRQWERADEEQNIRDWHELERQRRYTGPMPSAE